MIEERFDRNIRLFGEEGQECLRESRVVVVGVGGLGSHVVAQLALLGVGNIDTIDFQELSLSNRNRYIGAWQSDSIPGSPKVEIAKRHVQLIDTSIKFTTVKEEFPFTAGLESIKDSDYVVGCVDNDGVRFVLNEYCVTFEKPLIDLASDVPEDGKFGGRIVIITDNNVCLHCSGELDQKEVRRYLSSTTMIQHETAIYGIDPEKLAEIGPSVVSVNGTIASLGVTALMSLITGIKLPYNYLNYRGDQGTVSRNKIFGVEDCYYCSGIRGVGDRNNLSRYFR